MPPAVSSAVNAICPSGAGFLSASTPPSSLHYLRSDTSCSWGNLTSFTDGKFAIRKFEQQARKTGRPQWRVLPVVSKMFVPGKGPEVKAAETLHSFFNYVAVTIVLSQLRAYNRASHEDLAEFAEKVPLQDGDKWCALLMRESPRHKELALRIMEVRSAYAREDFEWENLPKLTLKRIEESNTRLMREFVMESLKLD